MLAIKDCLSVRVFARMSDPEDVQPDEDSDRSTGDWIYQLKRIGPSATLGKVPDVMRLHLGLTRIGRGQHNDYFLDSAVLKNFISRSHVEIFGKKNENGEIEYVLTDKGLNGTFINDIRTHKTCVLEVGDKITFGHTNGYKIQPGSYAEQPLSEFQFQFEKISKNAKTSEMFSEGLQSSHTAPSEEPHQEIIPDLKKDATIVSDRLFLSDLLSNSQSQDKTAKSRTSHKGRGSKDSSSLSDAEIDSAKNSSSVKGKRGSGKHNSSESANKSPALESSRSTKKSSGKPMFSETLPAMEKDASDDFDEDDEEEEEEEEREQKKKKGPKKGKTSLPKKTSGRRKVQEPPSESEESSEEDESCKPEADQRPKAQTVSSKQKQQPKKKKTGNDAPAIGSRKRRRKGGMGASSTATSSSKDLEPGVEWYEDDTCDAPDCKRPKKKRTPWVQCDDCDGWYHTVCVGANYNKLKDSDEHFNCGCE